MSINKKCEWCHKEFEDPTKSHRKRFCSLVCCRKKYRKQHPVDKKAYRLQYLKRKESRVHPSFRCPHCQTITILPFFIKT